MSPAIHAQATPGKAPNAESAASSAPGAEVQLKKDLRGKGFAEQEAMLAPGAAEQKTTLGDQLAQAPDSKLAVQLKGAMGALPHAEQIAGLEVPAPMPGSTAGAPVQMSPDPAAPATTSAPGAAPATTTPAAAPDAAPAATAAPDAAPVAAAAPGAAAAPQFDPAKDTKFGQPFESMVEATATEAWLTAFFLPAITAGFGAEVGSIWRAYLNRKPGDSLAPRKYGKGDEIGDAFIRSPTTHLVTQVVMEAAHNTIIDPAFAATLLQKLKPQEWVDFDVSEFLADPSALPINYANPGDIPGHLAGGVSGSAAGSDSRSVNGAVGMLAQVDGDGALTALEVRPSFQFHVADAVDFNPGGPGDGIEQRFTVPLSRLEASGLAYDVPFEVDFAAPDTRMGAPLPEAVGREKNVQDVIEVAETLKGKGFAAAGALLAEKARAFEQARLAELAKKAREVRDGGFAGLAGAAADMAGGAADKVLGLLFGDH